MTRITLPVLIVSSFVATFLCASSGAVAQALHGLAMHGEPALTHDFDSLPYANPEAPRGGHITYGARGRFDTLNPYTVKGRAPWILSGTVFESLMARSWDEPFTVYGLIAETIETDESRRWVEFTLRPEARFANGDPVTAEDVIFSMETLRDHGRPNFRTYYERIERSESPNPRRVRFVFTEPDRELPLLLGLMPVLSKADWDGKDFSATTLIAPLGTGPYRVASAEPGESVTLRRRADYWGDSLPVNRGRHNFERVSLLYFRDESALWQAFKAGTVHLHEENDPVRWQTGYDFPAARSGAVIRDEIVHRRATGMYGFVFNTRRLVFADRRVREALTHALDFEWISAALNAGALQRITSFYANSDLAFSGPAEGRERALLEPFADSLPPGTLDAGYEPPVSPGDGRNRANLREAARLLREAGWKVTAGRLLDADRRPFSFEILLTDTGDEKIAAAFAQSLDRLGIDVRLRLVDSAQYQERLTCYDYDMILRRWRLSLSPGAEQRFYFGPEGVSQEGTRNYMGAADPAIDAMIDAMLAAKTPTEYRAAVQALDRVLTAGRYVIPLWFEPADRIAWWRPLAKPERDPLYGYRPEVWWSNEN